MKDISRCGSCGPSTIPLDEIKTMADKGCLCCISYLNRLKVIDGSFKEYMVNKQVSLGYAICCLKGAIQIADIALQLEEPTRYFKAYTRLENDLIACKLAFDQSDPLSLIDEESRELFSTHLHPIAEVILCKLNDQISRQK